MMQPSLEILSHDNKAEAVDVLVEAFRNYPVMRYICRDSGDEYETHLRAVVNFYCEIRFLRKSWVQGIRHHGELVAVALFDAPAIEGHPLPQEQLKQLRSTIGEAAFERLGRFEETTSAAEPKEPHHYLGMIGVKPNRQGRGYSRILLEAEHRMAAEDPNSIGITLGTEDPANVQLYQRFGYRVYAEVDTEDLHSWCMILPAR